MDGVKLPNPVPVKGRVAERGQERIKGYARKELLVDVGHAVPVVWLMRPESIRVHGAVACAKAGAFQLSQRWVNRIRMSVLIR